MSTCTALTASALVCLSVGFAHSQQSATPPSAEAAACGPYKANFTIKRDTVQPAPQAVPAGKALVYVMEEMPSVPFLSTKVRVGVDGAWVGLLEPATYTSFTLDPGAHHLCALYQGQFAAGEEGQIILHHLDARPGKTYYLLYRGIFSRDSGEVAFFDQVDQDEGLYLVQSFDHATSRAKK